MKHMTRKTSSYLVDIRKTAASRITSDTTSWMARGNVGHLWVETISKVEFCEICRKLWKEQEKPGLQFESRTPGRHLKIILYSTPHRLAKIIIRKDLSFLNSEITKYCPFYQKSQNKFLKFMSTEWTSKNSKFNARIGGFGG